MSADPAASVRRLEYLPLGSLTPNPANPKAHAADTLNASVNRFGFVENITRDDRTGYIISGHGRADALKAMRDRGEAPPDGVTLDPDTGEWLVPVTVGWASRTDQEARAALIALNRTTQLGGWVDELLLPALDDLSTAGDDGLVGVGFTDADLQVMRRQAEAALTGATDPWQEAREAGLDYTPAEGRAAYKTVQVHFRTEQDYTDFADILGLERAGGGSGFWWPVQPAPEAGTETYDASTADPGPYDDDREPR
jgi:hypothetical protein